MAKTPMDAALSYLSVKARTVREVELHLDALNFGEYEIYQVVERLLELGYLSDEKYARDFVESRLRTKPVSKKKLKEQLFSHHLSKDEIDEALNAVSDEDEYKNALAAAEKLMPKFARFEAREAKNRLAKRLAARGYTYGCIRTAIEALYGDACDVDEASLEGEAEEGDEA